MIHPMAIVLLAMKAFTGIFTGQYVAKYKQSEVDSWNREVDKRNAAKKAAKGK